MIKLPSVALFRFYHRLLLRLPRLPFFIAVARLDKPIGIYLLLWPTLWALWLAAEGYPGWHLFLVFTLGTALTRSAGCIINDIADKDLDGRVERTQTRPLAAGNLKVSEALLFMSILMLLALLLVLTTNPLAIGLAAVAAIITCIYPLMKRYTYLPQVVLGIAFSFGIPMAYAATRNAVPGVAWLMLVANMLLTVAYDTIYAMVDRDDDLKIGIKSTAILFGDLDRFMIGVLQAGFIFCMVLLGHRLTLAWPYWLGLIGAAILLAYQQWLIKERIKARCFAAFLNNHWVGMVIFIGIMVHSWRI